MSKEATAEGTALIEEMLQAWVDATDGVSSDEDVVMADGEANNGALTDSDAAKLKREEERLRKVYEEFRPRLEANEWARVVLAQTY